MYVISLYTTVPADPAIDIISKHNLQELILSQTNSHRYTPMGSSISGILAISYMDQLERRELSIYQSCIFFTRYIDDILMLTSSSKEATAIYEKFQNIDGHIQFKNI